MSKDHPALALTREQILAFRRDVGGLDERLEAEAATMPLPGIDAPIVVRWPG